MHTKFSKSSIFLSLVALELLSTHGQLLMESTTTTLSLIADYGYHGEEHKVTTADNYIVTLYRIPYSPKNNSANVQGKRPVVFLMHGFGQSSCDWVLSGYPRGLAFLLSDAGYDVWMGNARGTRFSKKHAKLSPLDPAYWNFSWHEIGIYDLPANIDYILKYTLSTQLQFIGHSQGATTFLVATSSLPELNKKISSAFLLGPVAFIYHATTPIMSIGAIFLGQPHPSILGASEGTPNTKIAQQASATFCADSSAVQRVCSWLSFTLFGANSEYTNSTALEIYYETSPSGSSTKQLFHYMQLFNSKRFCQFDYGIVENLMLYQQIAPPDYKLEAITTPVYIYHSENDALAAPSDVKKLIDSLSATTLKKVYKIPFKSWNHIDFILGNNVDEILYRIVLNDLKENGNVE